MENRYGDNRGHTWITYADNDAAFEGNEAIDIFAYEQGEYHNGPRCKVCGYGFCHHCNKGPQVDCTGTKKYEYEEE
jgi:hypothetical protein